MEVITSPHFYLLSRIDLHIIKKKEIGIFLTTYALGLMTTQFWSLPALQKSLQRVQMLPWKPSLPIVKGKISRDFPGSLENTITSKLFWTGRDPKGNNLKIYPPLNFISFKKGRAKCKFIIKQAKTSSWRIYISKINSHTSIKLVWKKIRKIRGKENIPQICRRKNTKFCKNLENHLQKCPLPKIIKLFQIFPENQKQQRTTPLKFDLR